MLSAFPSGKGHPTPDDDAFWAEALRIRMPLTIHVDLDRSGPRDGPMVVYKRTAGVADLGPQVGRFAQRGAVNAVQLMLDGVFDRFPDLRILMAENQIGWVPTFMTVADERYDRHLDWAVELLGFEPLQNGHPSDYIRRHILWGFQRDPAGVEEPDLGLRLPAPGVGVPALAVSRGAELPGRTGGRAPGDGLREHRAVTGFEMITFMVLYMVLSW
jgi:hypothetical protein